MDTTVVIIVGGILGAIVSVGSILTFWMNFSGRISDSKAKAEAAEKQASIAVARVIALETALNNLRVKIAEDYVSKVAQDGMEKRVLDAINKLSERVDHAFANKGGH